MLHNFDLSSRFKQLFQDKQKLFLYKNKIYIYLDYIMLLYFEYIISRQRKFNKRISNARIAIENSFEFI